MSPIYEWLACMCIGAIIMGAVLTANIPHLSAATIAVLVGIALFGMWANDHVRGGFSMALAITFLIVLVTG
jgi:hypothetical protein